MANFTFLASSLFSFIVVITLFNLGGNMAQDPRTGQAWCVAKPSADEVILGSNIEYVCNQIGVDCTVIQEGGPCFYPDNIINHASVVMNLFFQHAGHIPFNCDFASTGIIALTDPSYGSCVFPA